MKQSVFSIPIFKYKVQDWNIKKKNLLELFNSCQKKVYDNAIVSPIGTKTNIFSEEIKLFEKEIGLNFELTEFWFQQYSEYMDHAIHSHGPYGYTSACFIEYDKNYHKPTVFISPFSDCITGTPDLYEADIEEGDIIFFPSNLLHYAPTNHSNVIRTIISFNLKKSDKKKNTGVIYS